jgi:hypothetical protein
MKKKQALAILWLFRGGFYAVYLCLDSLLKRACFEGGLMMTIIRSVL